MAVLELEFESWSGLMLAVAAVAGTLLYTYCSWNFDHWSKRAIPYIPPPWLFGMLARKSKLTYHEEMYKKLDGHRYGGFFNIRQPALLIRDPELAKAVLVKDFNSFHDNSFYFNENEDSLFSRNPFFQRGEKWKASRGRLSPAFTPSRIKPVFPLMLEVAQDLVTYVEKEAAGRQPDGFDAKDLSGMYTIEVVASCVFGIQGNSFKDPNAEFRKMALSFHDYSWWFTIVYTFYYLTPWLFTLFNIKLMSTPSEIYYRSIIKDVVGYREKHNISRNDFLQVLLQLKTKKDESREAYEYTDEDIIAHAMVFFSDGYETSSVVIHYVLYELAKHPDVQRRLRDEVDSCLNKNNRRLNYDLVQEMLYLDMVISETMRMHPPLSYMERMCTRPYDLPTPKGGVYRVQPGTSVIIPILALHNDSDHFPQPEIFDPERFSQEKKHTINKYTYLPFGEGPRICLGQRFAQIQLKACLASLVAAFEIRPTAKTPDHIEHDTSSFFLLPKQKIFLTFIPRVRTESRSTRGECDPPFFS